MSLRDRLQAFLGNWQTDLPRNWRDFFQECPDLNFDGIGDAPVEDGIVIWPGRRGRQQDGAPAGANICRAFERTAPEDVRVVVLGQDPYPGIGQATGRAFEDGGWDGARTEELASSLKPILLAALATHGDRAAFFRSGSWPDVRSLIQQEDLDFPELGHYFNTLAEQGVLFINATWTHSQDEHLSVHRNLWKPVTNYLLHKLAAGDQSLVFLLLGEDAKRVFCSADIVFNRSAIVVSTHPREPAFLNQENPLVRVNNALRQLDADRIRWWN